MSSRQDKTFFLSTLVDFPDDALAKGYTPARIRQMMSELQGLGVRRVFWNYYGGKDDGLFYDEKRLFNSYTSERRKNIRETFEILDRPLELAVKAAKENNMEIYAVIKPYETGTGGTVPEGSEQAKLFPEVERIGGPVPLVYNFVSQHPDMRIERRMDDIPEAVDSIPIRSIKLIKCDDRPTRIKKENIEIWTSERNYKYTRKYIHFTFKEEVLRNPKTIFDHRGNMITGEKQFIRTIILSGFSLTDKYILVTTNLKGQGDFTNIPLRMIEAYGPNDRKIPIVIAPPWSLWGPNRNFKNYGLDFDTGFGDGEFTACDLTALDEDSSEGKAGFIAFARGANKYLPGALCEAYPEVQEYFRNQVNQVLKMGVDGVEVRISCHSCHVDDPFSYGFNKPILDEYKRQYGVETRGENLDLNKIADIRAQLFSDFMRSLSYMVRQNKKKFGFSINLEFMRNNSVTLRPPDCVFEATSPHYQRIQRPWNINFNWSDWIKEGILDFVCLRTYITAPKFHLSDSFASTVLREANQKGIEVIYVRYVSMGGFHPMNLMREIELIGNDKRINSVQLYEVQEFTRINEQGEVVCDEPFAGKIREIVKKLGI